MILLLLLRQNKDISFDGHFAATCITTPFRFRAIDYIFFLRLRRHFTPYRRLFSPPFRHAFFDCRNAHEYMCGNNVG